MNKWHSSITLSIFFHWIFCYPDPSPFYTMLQLLKATIVWWFENASTDLRLRDDFGNAAFHISSCLMIFRGFLVIFTIQICWEIFVMIFGSERMQEIDVRICSSWRRKLVLSKMIFPFSGGTEKENEYRLVWRRIFHDLFGVSSRIFSSNSDSLLKI